MPTKEIRYGKILHRAALGTLTCRHQIAFQAQDRAMVDRFYQAALTHGGQDNGPPGERVYHPGYYAAFVLDPDGNNIEAVYHGGATRNVDSVEIQFYQEGGTLMSGAIMA